MTTLALYGGPPIRTRTFQPWPQSDQTELGALAGVLASRRWGGIYSGSQGEAFERALGEYLGVPHAAVVSSGTAGLMIALKALGVGAGDEVVVPAMTYVATATAVSVLGGTPVFADIDADTHTIDPASAEAAISEKTKAIIAVHLGGHPADMDRLGRIATEHSVPLVEDCAQSLGATWGGAHTGSLGQVGVFSFASTKNITAGEGGAVITHDAGLAARIASLRDHGRPLGVTGHHLELGWNLRLSEFQSSILDVQLERLDHQLTAKARGAAFLTSALSSTPGLRSVPADLAPRVTRHGRFSLAFTLDPEAFGNISISSFRTALRAEGIPVGLRDLTACPDEPIYADDTTRDYSHSRTVSCTRARAACTRLVMFGQAAGSGMLLDDSSELTDVVRAVEKIHDNCGQLREAERQRGTTPVPSGS
ncbi:DegT/DnrJ/EryC1/StrS family aminotransferase [Streptomyces sp. DSM 41014]|uniref:DegT/DnrJ/EryC1/StrS family aminotransferase n=1 Tax=Streptomyces hintoniae TaxID=3075521 RepID=A0ABU2UYP1_9ACTN|nr:DegT/DnrJ/EryC1/StrS family aminotransferase [Streptomyces sp. DSM 41014]MDT0478021.1 DegT/DnrJ/EryC1/StrS family aminotransferase [Streptomyces sp. DSM 41014]